MSALEFNRLWQQLLPEPDCEGASIRFMPNSTPQLLTEPLCC